MSTTERLCGSAGVGGAVVLASLLPWSTVTLLVLACPIAFAAGWQLGGLGPVVVRRRRR